MNSGLYGSYNLSEAGINSNVTLTSAGAYILGSFSNNTFYVSYVGRSDNDINNRLHDWVGKYSYFKFGYFPSPKAAFEKECNLYHDFGGSDKLDNNIHPQRPQDSEWQCPRCDVFNKQALGWY